MTTSREVSSSVNGDFLDRQSETQAMPEMTIAEERVKLIERLIQEAIDDPSPMVGTLKASGGDLLEMALHLKPQIAAAMNSCTNVEDLRDLQPILNTFIKLERQADRVLRLGQEISREDSEVVTKRRSR